jgi:AbiV family abortive infection protein
VARGGINLGVSDKQQPLKPGVLEDRFARLGLANARSLLKSGEALAAIEQYGHALALVALAMEELETAHAYRLVADGIASFDPKEARHIQYIDKQTLVMHRPKGNMLAERVGSLVYLDMAAKEFRRLRGREPDGDELNVVLQQQDEVVSPVAKKVIDSSEGIARAKAAMDEVRHVGALKNRGLYVIEKDGAISTPSETAREEYERYHSTAVSLFAVMSETTENGFPFEIAEWLRQSHAEYRHRMGRLEGPLNPKRVGDTDKSRSDLDPH